jgi:integrase
VTTRRTKGEGTIYFNRTSKRWVAQITLPNGQRKSKTSKRQKVVQDWLINQRKKANDGLYVTDEQIKLGDFLDRYLADVAAHTLRPRTYERYVDIINNHIKPELGNSKLSALRPEQVQALYSKKLNNGLSANTVRFIHAVLHKALFQALKWGLVSRNVSDLVDKPKTESKTFKTWSVDEVNRFLDAVVDHRWYPIYVLAIHTGLRQGELLGLHRDDIDLEKGVINVRHQISSIRGQGLTITEPKTDKAKRPVILPPSALEALKPYLEVIDSSPGLIFKTSTGKPISPRNILRHFKQVIDQVKLPEIRFHDLRHTHATLLFAAGVHPKVVQERLGHSQISLTLDTYSHVIPSLQSEAAEQFEAILGK